MIESICKDADFPQNLLPCIEKFFGGEHLRVKGMDLYPEVFETDVMFPLQRMGELAAMMRIARRAGPRCKTCNGSGALQRLPDAKYPCDECKGTGSQGPKVVFEIGCDKAGGLYHWIKCLPTVKRVIACEIRSTPYSKLFEKAFPEIDFLWLPESSLTERAKCAVRNWLWHDYIDCLFIDGDKSYFHEDFKHYLPLVEPKRGIVFFHDITDKTPGSSYRSCLGEYKHEEIIDRTDTWKALGREEAGIPPANAHEGWLRQWKGDSCGVGVIYVGKEW